MPEIVVILFCDQQQNVFIGMEVG